jgi:hypothetical protein
MVVSTDRYRVLHQLGCVCAAEEVRACPSSPASMSQDASSRRQCMCQRYLRPPAVRRRSLRGGPVIVSPLLLAELEKVLSRPKFHASCRSCISPSCLRVPVANRRRRRSRPWAHACAVACLNVMIRSNASPRSQCGRSPCLNAVFEWITERSSPGLCRAADEAWREADSNRRHLDFESWGDQPGSSRRIFAGSCRLV